MLSTDCSLRCRGSLFQVWTALVLKPCSTVCSLTGAVVSLKSGSQWILSTDSLPGLNEGIVLYLLFDVQPIAFFHEGFCSGHSP